MKILTLIRHAEADWHDVRQIDFERPLNPKGHNDAENMATWLVGNASSFSKRPSYAMVSSAQRTRETARYFFITNPELTMKYADDLYLAVPATILQVVQQFPTSCQHGMIIAHNPGIAEFASQLVRQTIDMPTGAVVQMTCDIPQWHQLYDTNVAITNWNIATPASI